MDRKISHVDRIEMRCYPTGKLRPAASTVTLVRKR